VSLRKAYGVGFGVGSAEAIAGSRMYRNCEVELPNTSRIKSTQYPLHSRYGSSMFFVLWRYLPIPTAAFRWSCSSIIRWPGPKMSRSVCRALDV